jgi:hypothetical protein
MKTKKKKGIPVGERNTDVIEKLVLIGYYGFFHH